VPATLDSAKTKAGALSFLGEARVQILRSHLLLSYVEVVFPLTLL
jgi:hypothetical protein